MPHKKTRNRKTLVKIPPLLIMLTVALLGLGYYVYSNANPQEQHTETTDKKEEIENNKEDSSTAKWKTYENDKFGYTIKIPDTWLSAQNTKGHGINFGTKLNSYNYTNKEDGYGFVNAENYPEDYGSGTPGPKVSEEEVVIDGVKATKRIFEGSGFENLQYPLTRTEVYDFKTNGNHYNIQFTSAVKNTSLWEEFHLIVSSWVFTD